MYRVPQYLHKPHQVLFMDSDEFVVFTIFFFLALVFGYVFWLMLFVGPYLYYRSKKKNPRGFLRHYLYKLGVMNIKGAPTYFERRFVE